MKTQTQSSRFCIFNGGPSRYQEQRKNSKELHGPRGWDSLVCYKKKAKVRRVGKRGEGSGIPRMVPVFVTQYFMIAAGSVIRF